MPTIVDIDVVKRHIKISLVDELDLSLKLGAAEALVLERVAHRITDVGSPTWADTVASWTADTIPDRIVVAIAMQAAYLSRFRGDDEARDVPAQTYDGLAPGVMNLIRSYCDPVLS